MTAAARASSPVADCRAAWGGGSSDARRVAEPPAHPAESHPQSPPIGEVNGSFAAIQAGFMAAGAWLPS
jgi:hypothetical protein